VIEAGLIETRDWASHPYVPGAALVTVNAGAPVKAGDRLLLRTGYHGELVIRGAYNAATIRIVPQPGHAPRVGRIRVEAAQNWLIRGLSVSPSHATPDLPPGTMVAIESHNWFGPAWDVVVEDCDIFTVDDASGWTADQWINLASSGVSVGGERITIRDNRVRNVRFGISVGGKDARIQFNDVDGFSADGLRGLGDGGRFEYNRIANAHVDGPTDGNHDDGFQSWSVGPGGVGTGQVRDVVLRGNLFVNHQNPAHPLRATLQGIGCFDGLFVNWVVEDNVVITDHWHGISFYGMRDSRIVNNTVIDLAAGTPGPPWIMVTSSNGTPSQNVTVRNNLATDYSLAGTDIVADHNVEYTNAAAYFVAPPFDLHLRAGSPAIDVGSSLLAPPRDADGVRRPQGPLPDLGAYEHCPLCLFADGFETADIDAWSASGL
jgi:nitrous oxidase accessory protein NosD